MNRRILLVVAVVVAVGVAVAYLVTTRVSFSLHSSVQIEHNQGNRRNTTAPKRVEYSASVEAHKNNASDYKEKALLAQNPREKESYWRSAIDEWITALEESPGDKLVLNELGYGCFYLMNLSTSREEALARFHEGVGYFDTVLSGDPNFHWAIFGLGMLYFDIAERTNSPVDYLRKAIEYFDKGFEYDANYIWGHMSKAWAYFKIGNATNDKQYYRKAIPEFERVLGVDPDNQLAKDGIRFSNEKL